MAYLPKNIVEKNIKVRVRKRKDGKRCTTYEAYFGKDVFTGEQRRITRASRKDLLKYISEFYAIHRVGGDAAVRLNAAQALDAKNAYDALAAVGLSSCKLFDAVNAFIEKVNGKQIRNSNKLAADAYEEFYDTKPEGTNKVMTRATCGRWVESLGKDRLLHDVTANEINTYLKTNFDNLKPKTYNQHLLYINTFLNWCCREPQEYLHKNPAKQLPQKPEPWEEPEYMLPQDVRRLFDVLDQCRDTRPDMLAFAILNFFCGCRVIEIMRMATEEDAARINIEEETIRIAKAKGYQQGKRPRAFHITPTALAWMKHFDFMSAIKKIAPNIQNDIYRLARQNNINVFHNCGRHTFITYHVAAYGDPSKTTAMVGTSEKMRADNYCGLATRANGEAFFAILPPVDEEHHQS